MRRNRRNDFWGSFSRSLNLQPAANLIAVSILRQKEDEKLLAQQGAEEEKQQQGQKAVMDLFRGGQNLRSPSGQEIPFIEHLQPKGTGIEGLKQGFTQTQKSTYKDYTEEEKLRKIAQIFPEPGQYFNAVSKLLNQKPEQKGGIKVGDNYYEPKEGYTNVPDLEKLITSIPPKDIRTEITQADTIKGQEKFEGYVQKVKREYDTDGNVISEELVNNPYKPVIEKSDERGTKYLDMSKEGFEEYDKRKKDYLGALALKEAFERGGAGYYISPLTGKLTFYDEGEVNKMVDFKKNDLGGYVDNNFSDMAKTYMGTSWEGISSDIDNVPQDIWDRTFEDYANGKMQPSTYKELYYKYISIFGKDPTIKYAQ